MVLEKTLESPLDCKEIKSVIVVHYINKMKDKNNTIIFIDAVVV